MKKLIYGAAIALLLGVASCDKSSESQTQAKFFSPEATDSLLISFGKVAGGELNGQIAQQMANDSTITKEEFLRGMQYAMAADTSSIYLQGVMVGIQLQNTIKYYRQMGLNVNTNLVIDNFKKAFLADSLPDRMAVSVAQADYRRWMDSLMVAKREYDRAQLMATPEAQENEQKGENYIKALAAQNDSVKVTESGLGYKIIKQGAGPKIEANDRVTVKYVAKTQNGMVVDRLSGMPMQVTQRAKALKEGVGMLSKGGKAVFYAPGRLAYGVEVPQGMPIGLNELIIYEVEVLESDPVAAPAAALPTRR